MLVCVRLSVSQSITLVYCIQKAEDIGKFLTRPGSPITLGFSLASTANSKGNSFNAGVKCMGWGRKIAVFD